MELIQTEHAPKAIGPYSQAVASGGFLFTSGQIPMKSDGTLVEGEIEGQTHQVFQNLIATLQAGALNLNDVVKVTLFISNMDDFTRINQVYSEYFVTHKQARTTVEVDAIA